MYSIVLTNGTIKNIKGDIIEWIERARMVKIYNDRKLVARINMDNVVGWIDADCMIKSEDK
jgi:hypothetical protein